MFSTLLSAAAIVATASAAFDPLSKNNVITYWGQGPNQERLVEICKNSAYDIINVGFVNVFPDQGKGGWPGTNFGNACWGDTYNNTNGVPTQLLKTCPNIGPDVIECQETYGKKIFLSIGGGGDAKYYLKTVQSARNFANFLWAAFGPASASTSDVPRPWGDAGVDGFDFDIESFIEPKPSKPADYRKAFYPDMIKRFKNGLFPTDPSKSYYISGAPQCIVPDAHLGNAVAQSWFDFLFIQFYNTDGCSARDGIMKLNGRGNTDISYLEWVAAKSLNPNVRMSIGLPAAKDAARLPKYWLNPTEAQRLVKQFYNQKLFGGVMVWEATYAANNQVCGTEYGNWMKNILNGQAAGKDIATKCPNKRDLSDYSEDAPEYEPEEPETTSTSCTSTSTITRSRSSSTSSGMPTYSAPGNWSIPAVPKTTSSAAPPYTSPTSSSVHGMSSSPAGSHPASPEQSSPSAPSSEAAPSTPADSYPTSPAESSPAASSPASPEDSTPESESCGRQVTVTVKEQSTVYVTATESAPTEDVTSLTTIQSTSTIYNTNTVYLTRSQSAPAGGAASGTPSSPASPEESSPSDYENSPVGGEASSSSAPAAPAYPSHGHQHGQGYSHSHGPDGGEEGPQSTTTVIHVVTVLPVPVSSGGAAQPTNAPYPYGPAAGNGTASGTAAPSASASAPAWPSYGGPQQTGGAGAVRVSATLMTAVALLAVAML